MIVDQLEHRSAYARLPPRLAAALEFLASAPLAELRPGYHPIDGSRLYAIVQHYETRPRAGCVWEAHRRYCDVQFVASGTERIGLAPLARMRVQAPYDDARDVLLLDGDGDLVTLHAGMFMLLWPHEAHMPGLMLDAPAPVHKVVVKAAVE